MPYVPDSKRYDNATFRPCGRSGLVLPPISLGLWQNFGGADVFETGRAMIRRIGKKKSGCKPELPDPEQAKPDDTTQRNFTDPGSRIMPDGANKGCFVQGYNAPIAVDSVSQVIVAAEVTQETNDKKTIAADER